MIISLYADGTAIHNSVCKNENTFLILTFHCNMWFWGLIAVFQAWIPLEHPQEIRSMFEVVSIYLSLLIFF